MSDNNVSNKELIYLEAFRQFSTKPYEKVTYDTLTEATKLSRGAIIHHSGGGKKELFASIVNEYIFKRSSITELSFGNGDSLSSFLDRFIENSHLEKKKLKKQGIKNTSLAMLNLCSEAFYYCPIMGERYVEWMSHQLSTWEKIIRIAIDKGEIKEDIEIRSIANLFQNVYLGSVYAGSAEKNGCNIDLLEKEFQIIYNFIKKS